MTTPFSLFKVGTRSVLFLTLVLSVFLLLPHAAQASTSARYVQYPYNSCAGAGYDMTLTRWIDGSGNYVYAMNGGCWVNYQGEFGKSQSGITGSATLQCYVSHVINNDVVNMQLNVSGPYRDNAELVISTCKGSFGGTGFRGETTYPYADYNPVPFNTPNPSLSVWADAQYINVGQSTTIHARFAASAGDDALTQTALNEVPAGGAETTILGYNPQNYDYTFTPTALGTYVFKPYVKTIAYPNWSTYGQSVTVNVISPVCSGASNGGATGTYPSCTCNNGGTFTVSTNSCSTPPTCSGASNGGATGTYPSCTCNNGGVFTASTNSCADPASCTFNGNTIAPGNSITAYQSSSVASPATCASISQLRTCINGVLTGSYAYSSCMVTIAPGSISSFAATPSRVHPGGSTTLTWSTSNMASCSVKSSDTPAQTLSTALSTAGLTTPAITRPETYTLSCTGLDTKSYMSQVQVKLVPVTTEL
jgi:hypothetical protein